MPALGVVAVVVVGDATRYDEDNVGKVLGVGGIRHNTGLQGELIRLGARFVIAGTDTNYVLAGARQDTAALRAIKID